MNNNKEKIKLKLSKQNNYECHFYSKNKKCPSCGKRIRNTSTKCSSCATIEFNIKTKRKYPKEHGLHSRLYRIWCCMKSRCYQKSHAAYKRYNSKGIIICNEWKNNYLKFRKWSLDNGYKDNLCLDRINNNGNYIPSNCRWVTQAQNANNSDNNIKLTIFGEIKNLKQWSKDKRCYITYSALAERIRKGINPEIALSNKHICPNCKKEFEGKFNKKYCSNKCHNRQLTIRSKNKRHEYNQRPEVKERWKKIEFKEKRFKYDKEYYQRPKVKAKLKARQQTTEAKEKAKIYRQLPEIKLKNHKNYLKRKNKLLNTPIL